MNFSLPAYEIGITALLNKHLLHEMQTKMGPCLTASLKILLLPWMVELRSPAFRCLEASIFAATVGLERDGLP